MQLTMCLVNDDQGQLGAFCVVASVSAETAHGEGGLEVRARWRDLPLSARTHDLSMLGMVTDPPPTELLRGGQIYYLAHFNAYRAVYSRQPPQPEP
jgi:hypothetical protein